eukprot:358735-Chlamydomonas_euryale.AAC.1
MHVSNNQISTTHFKHARVSNTCGVSELRSCVVDAHARSQCMASADYPPSYPPPLVLYNTVMLRGGCWPLSMGGHPGHAALLCPG